MRERFLHRCREQSFAIRAYAMSAFGLDVVSVHQIFEYRIVSTVRIGVVSSHMSIAESEGIKCEKSRQRQKDAKRGETM